MKQDYYTVLGIKKNSSKNEIKTAYRRLAHKYHPDINKTIDAPKKFKEISEAYQVLNDPVSRRIYDLNLNDLRKEEFYKKKQNPNHSNSNTHKETERQDTVSKRNNKLRSYIVFAVIAVIIFLVYITKSDGKPDFQKTFTVTKVISGDIIEIEGGEKVRYIGVDSPDIQSEQCFGREAYNENKSLVEGKQIVLQDSSIRKDQEGRLLKYAYLKLENDQYLFINDYLIRVGFAKTDNYPPDNKFKKEFKDAENTAMINQKGLWSNCR